ncbi:DinB family protein [Crocinitomix catalasitica]|nr:DinB family protein [Crocinitomix catalasitica]
MMTKEYRKGAIGAMMDEYERAVAELLPIVRNLDKKSYLEVLDDQTRDPDCWSIQTIMNHVVRAGYTYVNYIRKEFDQSISERIEDHDLSTPELACSAVTKMMGFTVETLEGKWTLSEEEMNSHKFMSRWGQEYDIEQILEHAIVHILRHRRQIERYLTR